MFFRFAALSALLLGLDFWYFVRLNSGDSEIYEKLIAESVELRTRKALEKEPAFQKRYGVQKEIWTQNETRGISIQSLESDLTIAQKGGKIEAIEKLKEIECHTLNGDILRADEGIYSYPSHQFRAQNRCTLTRGQSQIEGSSIEIDLEQNRLLLEQPKGNIAFNNFAFSAKKLLWEKEEERLYLTDEVKIWQGEGLTLLSQNAVVQMRKKEPALVTLTNNVRLISSLIQGKESFATADSLTYDPTEKTLLFGAERKVLFWQEGLSMSAKEVLVGQDQRIEGHGDVHFTFDLEEQNFIKEAFRHYL